MKRIHQVLHYEIFPRQETQFPLPWHRYFHRQAPLMVEIGFGNGAFLVEWARQHPEANFIGFEIALESMERAQKLIHTSGLQNVRVIREEARWGLAEFFADNTIHHVMMNFPDPWPKKRHLERRAINASFVQILGAVLKTDGIFELVTDQRWYAEAAHAQFSNAPQFAVEEIQINPPRPVQTKYERKWKRMGRDIYQLQVRKIADSTIKRKILEEPMPHKLIQTPITPEQVFALRNFQFEAGYQFFIVKEVFASEDGNHFLIKTIAKDEDYLQKFFITIAPHQTQWIVKLDTTTQPYRTAAVKLAIHQIADRLTSRQSEQ